MKTIQKICLNCGTEFSAQLKEHEKGYAKFCSRKCSGEYNGNKTSKKAREK